MERAICSRRLIPLYLYPRPTITEMPKPIDDCVKLSVLSLPRARVEDTDQELARIMSVCHFCSKRACVGDQITLLKCNHAFHLHCGVPWLEDNNECPLFFCKAPPFGSCRYQQCSGVLRTRTLAPRPIKLSGCPNRLVILYGGCELVNQRRSRVVLAIVTNPIVNEVTVRGATWVLLLARPFRFPHPISREASPAGPTIRADAEVMGTLDNKHLILPAPEKKYFYFHLIQAGNPIWCGVPVKMGHLGITISIRVFLVLLGRLIKNVVTSS
ncbi:hypothetical protein CASFOL_026820 [Castilleja foliolosa]|uniref:RING-type domain-containing protein n=1 Tax=Castilleja foliolosa TaxID=1961234 RepID=A0ABD3CIY9_9LAMI